MCDAVTSQMSAGVTLTLAFFFTCVWECLRYLARGPCRWTPVHTAVFSSLKLCNSAYFPCVRVQDGNVYLRDSPVSGFLSCYSQPGTYSCYVMGQD